MPEDKTALRELIWLNRLKQAEFCDAQTTCGWFSEPGHSSRMPSDYCPFECEFCDVQAYADGRDRWETQPVTPVL